MGYPLEGELLALGACRSVATPARTRALEQVLNLWHRQKHRTDESTYWGEELEYTLVHLNSEQARATLFLGQQQILKQRQNDLCGDRHSVERDSLQPEWATYMIEAVPGAPYGSEVSELVQIEKKIQQRRNTIRQYLGQTEDVVPICVFPRFGADSESVMPPDESLGCPDKRYQCLRENISQRKQRQTQSHIPLYQDPAQDAEHERGFLCLNGMDMGLGSCSLQVTVQATSAPEARWIHDQLIPLGPVMLALTAAAPAWKGRLVDRDSRWSRYSACVDDRTAEEIHYHPPRWDSNQAYISEEKPEGVDRSCPLQPFNEDIKQRLVDGGMDHVLATHYASILSRDPIMLTDQDVDKQAYDSHDTNVLEKFQGAVWPTVRLKPPPNDKEGGPGWRVEFRPMEIQMTDFDNAAFTIFMVLAVQAISHFHLDFYVPLDQVNESMESSQLRDAVLEQRVWFRRTGWPSSPNGDQATKEGDDGTVTLMTVNQIINGEEGDDPSRFQGIMAIIRLYLREHCNVSRKELGALSIYLKTVSDRARGVEPTPARWIRQFVTNHDEYHRDGHISGKICYDLVEAVLKRNT